MTYQSQTENNRACVFIDSSNPELPNQVMNHSSHLFIKPPFPPLIDPKDLLIISKDNKPSRSPNAFIIYRKVFLKTTRDQGYFLPMTIVSSMASKSWDQESDEIRSYYKKLAKEAYKYRTEKFPKKVKRRRKKEPWNGNIAFQNDLRNTFFDNSNSTENLSLSPEFQPIKPSPDMFYSSNNEISSQDSSISSQNSSPYMEYMEQQINEISLFNENNQFQQDLFSSPNLSNNNSITSSPNINEFNNPELLMNNNTEFDLYNQDLTNLLLLNQSYLNEFSNTSNNQIDYSENNFDYNATDSSAQLYSTDLLNVSPYQDILGITIGADGFSYM